MGVKTFRLKVITFLKLITNSMAYKTKLTKKNFTNIENFCVGIPCNQIVLVNIIIIIQYRKIQYYDDAYLRSMAEKLYNGELFHHQFLSGI